MFDSEITHCPVCASNLGRRKKGETYRAYCLECKAHFTWQPKAKKPTVVLASHLEKGTCGCGRCSR